MKTNRPILFTSTFICGIFLAALTGFTAPIPDDCKIGGFAIAARRGTFNNYTSRKPLTKTAAAGGKIIEFYPGQKLSPDQPDVKFDHNASDEIIAQVQAQLKKDGIRVVNYGVGQHSERRSRRAQNFLSSQKNSAYGITTESSLARHH